ncbi:aminotransferase class V-fold PLP-dependent enzyme [uncultured Paraglaciecola sp.]|uniref:aminotransferase class V-fold PLP-dependent enzyme n=1 Tax=uncultured Paraglaciecola sp. TaxID=1765024 RepID=UPI0025E9DA8E|nr:aminotransferase class V-fold PLP-dependent enzyme [uncultured Paraglaciecola sp.]
MNQHKNDFLLANSNYLLNHSVGRPLKTAEDAFKESFFAPWQHSGKEPWGSWLDIISNFQLALSVLFNAPAEQFCPQVNLSSSLTKIVMSLASLNKEDVVILMSEIDFPSMGFALQKALPKSAKIRFIDKSLDITNANVWLEHLNKEVDLVFISNAYSNTGQLAPVHEVISQAKELGVISVLDIAQSAGVIPLNLQDVSPDFMLGSSVKWLCGGPGAAYLWVNPNIVEQCQPKDVGWFSHENPFEFDIHNFSYNQSAMKFWGGTPSITPFALASHSIHYFASLGASYVRAHNQKMIDLIVDEFDAEVISPIQRETRSGTVILNFKDKQKVIMDALGVANISVDARHLGMRVSAHIYNDADDIQQFIDVVKQNYS